MQGAEKCMQDGDATVCTCHEDLCNSSVRTSEVFVMPSILLLTATVALLTVFIPKAVLTGL